MQRRLALNLQVQSWERSESESPVPLPGIPHLDILAFVPGHRAPHSFQNGNHVPQSTCSEHLCCDINISVDLTSSHFSKVIPFYNVTGCSQLIQAECAILLFNSCCLFCQNNFPHFPSQVSPLCRLLSLYSP
jgi:hypothetical protein